MESTPAARCRLSLAGLSVGDALGQRFFGPSREVLQRIADRELPPRPWRYTDDTEMSLALVQTLQERGGLDPDHFAGLLAKRFDPTRGYGSGALGLLQAFRRGVPWREAAPAMFGGSGSFGNGAAMRITPLGAWFADDPDLLVSNAARSARVTHAHPEAVAGAIAVAVAAGAAWRQGEDGNLGPEALFSAVRQSTPPSQVADGIAQAEGLAGGTPPEDVAALLGSGQAVSAQDTVPFVIWCAAHNLADYRQAFWLTVRGLGDRDTTCAMVGGIVALSTKEVPADWIAARERLPDGF